MGRLAYAAIASLDGYLADDSGDFSWAMPDEQVHAAANDLHRGVGTFLYGRRLYEVMAAWERMEVADEPAVIQEYAALWRPATKIVYSTTLDAVSTAHTTIERDFDARAVRRLKEESAADLLIGGATLATVAARAGLIDDWHLFLHPILVGAGLSAFPPDVRSGLDLVGHRAFPSGVVQLSYRLRK